MAYRKKHFLCFLCILTCTPLAQSFNVDELCAKRCLYGRGGVLCNCNAMHFNGKRSGSSEAPTNDLRGYNTQDNYDQYPREHSRSSLSPNKFIYYGSMNSHDVQPFKKKEYDVDIGTGQEVEVKRTKEITRYPNDVLNRNVISLLPDSSLNEGEKENNSGSNDDDFVETRREIASAIKQILSRSMMASRGQARLANSNNEFVDDSNDRSGEDEDMDDDSSSKYNNGNNNINNNNIAAAAVEEPGWRQHLRRLQKVMRQVHHLR
ncbi:unnamed protein product [Candidula unifasciata]|uniref:Uncharacterized protein n=1 Tax=Candidula unifasciata TaxID=100452 RepID=A0A8S3YR10_9EUPU|nr:unnamed protein product [Candidula unifasciata]